MNIKKIDNMIRYAYQEIPFYTLILNNCIQAGIDFGIKDDKIDYSKIPIIEKNDIINGLNLFSTDYILQHESDIIYSMTSGSTGKSIEIAWNRYDDIRSMLPLWIARYKYYGIHTADRFCYFFTTRNEETKIFYQT